MLSFLSAPVLAIGYFTLIFRAVARQDTTADIGWQQGHIEQQISGTDSKGRDQRCQAIEKQC